MLARFPRLSKVTIKILEIAGAGCASALAATLLGNTREASHPPAPPTPPAVVRLAPVDEQMIRFVRDEGSALVEQLRSASDQRSASAPSPAPVSQAAKPPKPAPVVASRREQKSTAAPGVEAKQRPTEAPTVHAAGAAAGSEAVRGVAAPAAPNPERMPPPPSAATELGWPSAQTQVPLRLWPAATTTSLPDAPRPPASVGEFVSRSM